MALILSDGFEHYTGARHPHCVKCNKPVETYWFEFGTRIVASKRWPGVEECEHTGEIFMVVCCHGEEWRGQVR